MSFLEIPSARLCGEGLGFRVLDFVVQGFRFEVPKH